VKGMTQADVVIAGAGPTGLMLASELLLAGVRPVVLDRLPEPSQVPKGNGLIGQIVPMLDYRGLLDRFRAEATYAGPVPRFGFGQVELDLGRLGTSPLHILAIPQRRLERLLADRVAELGGSVRREQELTGLAQDDDGVTLELRGPSGPDGVETLRTRYLVGCDGAHSLVRKQAGIGFPGFTSSELSRIGRVRLPDELIVPGTGEIDVPGFGRVTPVQRHSTPRGGYSIAPLAALDKTAPRGLYIVFTSEENGQPASSAQDGPMTLDELSASFRRVLGADLPMSDPQWLTRTVGNSRQADRYRADRVLVAGDAAHLVGLGGALNTGLMDAINLGWKLAAEVRGSAPDGLLDTYHDERHLAGSRAVMQARAQKALSGKDEAAAALRELMGELLRYDEPLRHVGELLEGADVRYPMPGNGAWPHPLVGGFAPDLAVDTSDGRTRVAELLRPGHGVLLDFTPDATAASAAASATHVTHVAARMPEPPAPALLIRPDGYVAWAGTPPSPGSPDPLGGLPTALAAWFGPVSPPPPASGSPERSR
jgi:2-polyprenyl-6-methoxyphenol hydroxylase-like FAD-dependent oxidoreductase